MMYYLRLFVRTLYISLFVAFIVTVSFLIYDYGYRENIYEASVGILVNEDINSPYVESEEQVGGVITDTDFTEYLLNMAIHYINTPEIRDETISRLSGTIPDIKNYNFKENVKCSTYAGSNVVTIAAQYESNSYYPVLIANTMVEVYKELTAKKLGADYFILLSRATENTVPVNMSSTMGCLLYGGGSLILTYVLVLMIDSLARSEGTYLTWKLFRKRRKNHNVIEEVG